MLKDPKRKPLGLAATTATEERRFIEVWTTHHAAVYRGCLARLRGRFEEADEAYSRTAALAFQSFQEAIPERYNVRAWLLKLAVNVCIDLHRERKRRRQVSLDELSERQVEQSLTVTVPYSDPESTSLQREQDLYLRSCISQLTPRLRRPAELRFIEGMRYREIARELGLLEPNVRKRIQEARRLLRRFHSDYLTAGAQQQHIKAVPEPSLLLSKNSNNVPCKSEGTRPEGGIVRLRAVRISLSIGLERDVVLRLTYRPKRRAPQRMARLTEYIRQHPGGWKKRLELARALCEEGCLSEAIPHYRRVLKRQPYPLPVWLELGCTLQVLGLESKAIKAFREGAQAAGREADRLHLYGQAMAGARNFGAAREAFQAAAASDPRDPKHLRALGEVCLQTGLPVEAVQSLERAMELDPTDPLTLILSHDSLLACGRPLAAVAQVSAAVEQDSSNFLALERLIRHRLRGGLIDGEGGRRTRQLLRTLRRLCAERAEACGVAALYESARGRWREGESCLTAYLERHPKDSSPWLLLARVRISYGSPEGAAAAGFEALRLAPRNREIYLALCRILPYTEAIDQARRLANEISHHFAGDAVLLAAASCLAVRVADLELAHSLCRRAVRLEPRLPGLRFRHARVLVEAGRIGDAIAELEVGWGMLPPADGYCESTPAALLIARCRAVLGSDASSRDWLRTAIEHADSLLAIDPATAMAYRGQALERLGDFDQSLEAYRAALHLCLRRPHRQLAEAAVRRLGSSPQNSQSDSFKRL